MYNPSPRPWKIRGRHIIDAEEQVVMDIDAAFISDSDAQCIVAGVNFHADILQQTKELQGQ